MRRQAGFSLIELLIVIAIILCIAAMAIPNLLRSKLSANEASAVSGLRTIATAQTTYSIAYPSIGYASQLTALGLPATGQPMSSSAAGLLDWVLGCPSQPCPKSGYLFSIVNATGTPVSAYDTTAVPQTVGTTGRRGFCSDQVPTLTYDPNGGAACTEPMQ
jgi:prepilin-type N-terminal cleavage/methylation domain-containing protein